MGLLSKIGDVVQSVTKPIAGILGIGQQQGEQEALAAGQAKQDALTQKRSEYQQKLAKEAQGFRDHLPEYKEEGFRIQEDSAKQNLAKDMAGVRSAANSRGLLYSGLREGAEAGTLSDFYANQSAEKAKINQQSEDVARGMEEKALGLGMQTQQDIQLKNDQAYDMALQQRAGRQSGISKLMSVGGGLLGGQMGKS